MTKRSDYVEQAIQTLSNQFHSEMVSPSTFNLVLKTIIAQGQYLDHIKKALFYGRPSDMFKDNTGAKESANAWAEIFNAIAPYEPEKAINYIHGIIGAATESIELLEALLTSIRESAPIDAVNVMEEVGDSKWYMAVLAHTAGFAWGDDEAVNIAKLRRRFPNKFTEYDANNRNLEDERRILEYNERANNFAYEALANSGGGVHTEAERVASMNAPYVKDNE